MALSSSNVTNAQSLQNINKRYDTNQQLGIVYDVFLNEDNNAIQESGDFKSKYVGAIKFRLVNDTTSPDSKLQIAYPKNLNYKSLPVKNEYVSITKGDAGYFVYERTGSEITPNLNSDFSAINTNYANDVKAKNTQSNTYRNVFSTGISRSNVVDNDFGNYGSYFEKQDGIHKLRLFEGDTLIESRFGQSIRLSGYNNSQSVFSPTLIIRNQESNNTQNLDFNSTVLEDVNRDGSIIVLGSNQYRLDFKAGVIDERGRSNFETKPNSFKSYPSNLIGHQMLLNSGRVIISAKSDELIFYSKKNYGFISDGGLSIDNKFGIDANVGDDVNITTNNRSINLNTGNGKINLGNNDLESIVRGESLVRVLTELIDAITQQVYLTPAGTSSVGPTNLPVFLKIKAQLNTILSKLNKTS